VRRLDREGGSSYVLCRLTETWENHELNYGNGSLDRDSSSGLAAC
jgi:hypothetical protein